MKYVRIEGAVKLDQYIEPMKAELTDKPAFNDPGWVFEIKWDGYRAVAEIGKENKLYSRNGLTFSKAYPKVFSELKKIKPDCIIDGEIIVLDEKGKPSFQKLQNYKNTSHYVIQYYVFDCLSVEGKSITHLTLLKRKEILKGLLPESNTIRYCDHVEQQGKDLFKEIKKHGYEGIIAKRSDSTYRIGKRSADWLKIKNVNTQEAIIVGFTAPKGSRKYLGSLLLAVKQKGKLVYIGNVGTGYTEQILKDLYTKLKPISRKDSPLDVPVKVTPDSVWVDPIYVCNIKYAEMTEEGIVRHSVFQGLRVDKSPNEVKLDKPSRKS